MSSYDRGFRIIVVLALAFLFMILASGCVSFRSKGDPEPMIERAERICKDTGGRFVNFQCDYSDPPDTTIALLGVQT